MQRQESRLVMCGYAINAFHDDERRRRKREGISDEQSWHQHCEQARIQFPLGKLSERCGKPAVILTLHREGDLLPYCASCFSYDAAVNDGGFIFIRLPSFSSKDLNKIAQTVPEFHWFSKSLEFIEWERVIAIWELAKESVYA